jgi:prepilin signal peptidase PulO-like enzyme (type II secretory pathway)
MIVIKIIFSVICGWTIGVIINYLSDTLPVYRRLTFPVCIYCNSRISVVDYYFGKECKNCSKPQVTRFWLINILVCLVVIYEIIFTTGTFGKLISEIIIYSLLLLITVVDIEHHLVLNMISLAGVVIFGILGVINHDWLASLIGGLTGFGVMFIFFIFGHLYSRYISRKRRIEVEDGIGFGDVTLSAVCGLLLGWPGVIGGLFLSIILGGLWSLGMILVSLIRKQEKPLLKYIAYAPFITIATGALWIIRK